jgi:(S)-citramalyl-CoA lyase
VPRVWKSPDSLNGRNRFDRVNHPHTGDGVRDLLAVLESTAPPDGLILPKIEHDEEVRNAARIAAAMRGRPGPQITCLFLGTADFSASIGSDLGREALAHARAQVVLAAREVGIDAMDGAWFDPADTAGLVREARRVAAMGFTGKASYDAAQLPVIHAAFAHGRGSRMGRSRARRSGG